MRKQVPITVLLLGLAGAGGIWVGKEWGYRIGISQGKAIVPGATLVTNIEDDGYILVPLHKEEGVKKVYNARIIAVSQSYAEMIDYKYPERIMALPPGIHAAEFQIISEGNSTNCYYRFLVDSNLPLDLPSIDVVPNRSRISIGHAKEKHTKNETASIESARLKRFHFNNYYSRNVYLATETYDPGTRDLPYVMRNPMLWSLKRDFWPGMHLIELSMGTGICSSRLHTKPNTALWIKKLDGKDYTHHLHLDPKDFYKFTLPEAWWREGAQVIEDYEQAVTSQPRMF